jgi:hypothetical protein
MGGPDRVLFRRDIHRCPCIRSRRVELPNSVSTWPLFTTSLTVTDNRGRSIFATRVLVAQLTLIVPAFNWRSFSISSSASLQPIPHLARRYIRTALALIAVVALIGPLRKSAQMAPTPAPTHARVMILNVGIWTVRFGIDNAGRDSQRSM